MATGNGIQWLMELDAKLEGARAMVKELSASEKAADDADKALKKVEGHTFLGLAKEIFKAELALKALEKGAELAWEGVKKVGEKLWEGLNSAAGEQRMAKAFDNMLGPDDGKEIFEYLEKFADLSEFTEGPIKRLGMELLQAGLRGNDFKDAIALASDVAAQAPDKMAGMEEAVASLARINLLGKVDARTLRGLRLNPHEVAEQMSADLGMSREAIAKQLEAGTLAGAKAMQSIITLAERKTGKQLGGLGMAMADEVEAKLSKLKSIPDEMAQNLRNTQGFKDIEDALGHFLDTVKPRLLDTTGLMGSLMDAVGSRLKNIDWDRVCDKMGEIVEQARQWGEMLKPVVSMMAEAADIIGKIPSIFGFGAKNPNAGKGTEEERAALEAQLGGFASGLARYQDDIVTKIADLKVASHGRLGDEEIAERLGVDLGTVRALGIDAGRRLADGIDVGIRDMFPKLDAASHAAIGKADQGVREAAQEHSPSRLFAHHGEMLAEGLAQGMEIGSARVAAASAAMVPVPSVTNIAQAAPAAGLQVGSLTVPVAIHVGGGSPSSATEIAHEVQAILPNMLIGVLEQVAVQAGAA